LQEVQITFAVLVAVVLQEQVQGYSALSQQLAQDYNVHADTVMGHASSARTASAQAGSSKAAAAAGQPASEMSDEDRQRFRQQAGEEDG
jgi:ribosomal protein L12E/L44/L45/RPP1/RPP2